MKQEKLQVKIAFYFNDKNQNVNVKIAVFPKSIFGKRGNGIEGVIGKKNSNFYDDLQKISPLNLNRKQWAEVENNANSTLSFEVRDNDDAIGLKDVMESMGELDVNKLSSNVEFVSFAKRFLKNRGKEATKRVATK